ncbi:hypothetical protein H0H81_009047 [Sphagnurus paluster]|uniref:Uncharacterized protein n=1 Tax=Sphagnurus paluster TaxID=117069 RepID=A0A9P7FVN4_9AGAR|nr:hypothetical protein H0H81_009047 [Sphagnurus paluster]
MFADDTPLTQDQRIQFYKTSSAAFGDTKVQEKIKDILVAVGEEAIQTQKSFRNIKDKFDDFVKTFPDVLTYAQSWDKLYDRWFKAFHESQDYASATATNYQDDLVGVVLELVSRVDLDDEKDVNKQVERLDRFSKQAPPPEIPAKYEDAFTNLNYDVKKFRVDFTDYLTKKGKEVTNKIKKIEGELKTLEDQLTKLNKQVHDWKIGLASTAWLPIVGGVIAGTGLAVVTKKRDEQAKKVKDKTKELDDANKEQAELQKMVTAFSVLEHDFDTINASLFHLSKIWADMRSMSIQFSTMLKKAAQYKGKDEEEFQLALEHAKASAKPLHDSLIAYATHVGNFLAKK